MSALPEKRYTVEEYFAIEGVSEVKHEYLDGQIYAMSGGHPNHNLISVRTIRSLENQLDERPCFTFNSDQRVDVRQAALYAYPDVTVVCGEPEYSADGISLTNPTLIVEVSSPSTEKFDRGAKFRRYQTLASLQQYVLIAQDEPLIEIYSRYSGQQWLYTAVHGLDATVTLESIGCTLALADVYRRVTFDPPLSEA